MGFLKTRLSRDFIWRCQFQLLTFMGPRPTVPSPHPGPQVGKAAPHMLTVWVFTFVCISGTLGFPCIPFHLSSIFKTVYYVPFGMSGCLKYRECVQGVKSTKYVHFFTFRSKFSKDKLFNYIFNV